MPTHLIVGAGQAGGQAARTMREQGFAGDIIIVGAEHHPPHQRPPLSKAVLLGKVAPEKTHLFKAQWYEENRVRVHSGERVVDIDAQARQAMLASGARLGFDKLLLATGATLRRLRVPGADLTGVYYLRTIDECLTLREVLRPGTRVVVIGAGFIGLEVAASARTLGCEVRVLEVTDRLMGRAVDPWLGEYFARLHRARGVDIHRQMAVTALDGDDHVREVVCDDGRFAADAVVVGVGIEPDIELARRLGAAIDNGIAVDAQGRTSIAGVYACGDAASHVNSRFGGRLRLESWENAQNQAIVAATHMCGGDAAYDPVPWFWTNQYDVNLQMAGVASRWEQRVVRGDPDDGPFLVFYLCDGRVVSCSAVNNAREMRSARALIERGVTVDTEKLQDRDWDLKKLQGD